MISAKSSLTSQLEMEAKMLQKTPKKMQKDDLDSDRDTDGEEKQVQVSYRFTVSTVSQTKFVDSGQGAQKNSTEKDEGYKKEAQKTNGRLRLVWVRFQPLWMTTLYILFNLLPSHEKP